jgi:hypothetical protein
VFRLIEEMRVAELSIALGILAIAVICVYVVERAWFHQRRERAASIAISAASANEGGIILVMLLLVALNVVFVPLATIHFVQRLLLGKQRALAMQPAVFLRKACLALTPGVASR